LPDGLPESVSTLAISFAVDAYVWRFGPSATATRQRDLLVALQELAGQLDPLQFAILKGRIANF
jgi:hypothetical protein